MSAQWMVLLLLPLSAFTSPIRKTGTLHSPSNSGIRYLTGTNGYGYIADDHYKIEMRNSDGSVEGVYGYRMPDGNTHVTSYVSDKKGHRLQENDVLQRFRSQGGILQRFYQGSPDKRHGYEAAVPVQTVPYYYAGHRSSPGESVHMDDEDVLETYEVPVEADEVLETYGVPVGVDEVPEVYREPIKGYDDPYNPENIYFGTYDRFTGEEEYIPATGQAVPGPALASVAEVVERTANSTTDSSGNDGTAITQSTPASMGDTPTRFTTEPGNSETGTTQSVPAITENTVPPSTPKPENKEQAKLRKKADHAVALPDAKAVAPGAGVAQSRIQGTAIAGKEAYASPVASSYTGKGGMSLSSPNGVAIVGPGGVAIADTFSLSYASMDAKNIKELRSRTKKTRKQMRRDPKPQPLYYRDFTGRKERFESR